MTRTITSPIGPIHLIEEDGAIIGLYFREGTSDASPNPILDLCEKELTAYFDGKLQGFTVPVRLKGTDFRKQVWDALKTIPYGKTVSYKDIALQIDNPKAVRAVGGANHNNPVSIIIPCHRVVGANGSLTGYGGGMDAKKWLLELEAKNNECK